MVGARPSGQHTRLFFVDDITMLRSNTVKFNSANFNFKKFWSQTINKCRQMFRPYGMTHCTLHLTCWSLHLTCWPLHLTRCTLHKTRCTLETMSVFHFTGHRMPTTVSQSVTFHACFLSMKHPTSWAKETWLRNPITHLYDFLAADCLTVHVATILHSYKWQPHLSHTWSCYHLAN